MICSDIMARGMDFSQVDCVVNYDCPKALRTYVHRIGRTARAGFHGTAITVLAELEVLEKF